MADLRNAAENAVIAYAMGWDLYGVMSTLADELEPEFKVTRDATQPKEWRCWFCDEVFTHPNDARLHFGADLTQEPGCVLKLTGADNGLLHHIRELYREIEEHRHEIDPLSRYVQTLLADHGQALVQAEQAGYDKGLADGRCLELRHPWQILAAEIVEIEGKAIARVKVEVVPDVLALREELMRETAAFTAELRERARIRLAAKEKPGG